MTIKDLKDKIALLDDNMRIGASGHFGEFLECLGVEVRTVENEKILYISMEDAGDEPD